jgi:hypothetical protein
MPSTATSSAAGRPTSSAAPLSPLSATQVAVGDLLLVKNVDTRDWIFRWANHPYSLPQGHQIHLPFEAVKLYLGDPRSTVHVQHTSDGLGRDEFIPDRASEIRRLYQLYPPTDMTFRDMSLDTPDSIPEHITDRTPLVEVYTLEGDRVYTVVDDPTGERVIAAPTVSRFDEKAAAATIARLQDQVNLLMDRFGVAPTGPGDGIDANDADDDAPGVDFDSLPEDKVDGMAAHTRPELRKVPPRPAPVSVLKEAPHMVMNARTGKVGEAKIQVADPTTLSELPEDS